MADGAIQQVLNRKLSLALLRKWQSTAAKKARQQFLLADALSCMLKRKIFVGWEKWQQN